MKSIRKMTLNVKYVLQAFRSIKINPSQRTVGKVATAKQHITMLSDTFTVAVHSISVVPFTIPEDKRAASELLYFDTVPKVVILVVTLQVIRAPFGNLSVSGFLVCSAISRRAFPAGFPVTRDGFRR